MDKYFPWIAVVTIAVLLAMASTISSKAAVDDSSITTYTMPDDVKCYVVRASSGNASISCVKL